MLFFFPSILGTNPSAAQGERALSKAGRGEARPARKRGQGAAEEARVQVAHLEDVDKYVFFFSSLFSFPVTFYLSFFLGLMGSNLFLFILFLFSFFSFPFLFLFCFSLFLEPEIHSHSKSSALSSGIFYHLSISCLFFFFFFFCLSGGKRCAIYFQKFLLSLSLSLAF